MRRIGKLTARILAQNAGRDLDRLRLKLARLRQDPFAFFRGTNPLFLGFLPRRHPLFRAPRTLVCGDLHLENFGTYKGDNRLCYFDINDFDEACAAPFTVDLVRFVAGLRTAAGPLGLSRTDVTKLIGRFLDAYVRGIADGKPRWVERSLAQGVFRSVSRRAMQRTRRELLDRITSLKSGRRRIRIDGVRAMSIDAGERRSLRRFLAAERGRLSKPERKRGFFDLLDAARRIAGCGSLGLARYMLLIRGRGAPDQQFVLDLKFAAPSAVSEWLDRAQPGWADDAVRVVSIQRIMQAVSPAMLDAVRFERRPFVVKELQPSTDRLDLARMRPSPNVWCRRSRAWGISPRGGTCAAAAVTAPRRPRRCRLTWPAGAGGRRPSASPKAPRRACCWRGNRIAGTTTRARSRTRWRLASLPTGMLRLIDRVQTRIRARDAEHAAAHDLDDLAEGGDVRYELADLDFGAGELHDVARRVRRQHPAAEAPRQRFDRVHPIRGDLQLDEHQLAGEMISAGHVLHRHHVHELEKLGVDLRDHVVGAGGDQRQARDGGVVGGRDRERFNVVAAGRDESGDARERARFVLQEYCDEVAHGLKDTGRRHLGARARTARLSE